MSGGWLGDACIVIKLVGYHHVQGKTLPMNLVALQNHREVKVVIKCAIEENKTKPRESDGAGYGKAGQWEVLVGRTPTYDPTCVF